MRIVAAVIALFLCSCASERIGSPERIGNGGPSYPDLVTATCPPYYPPDDTCGVSPLRSAPATADYAPTYSNGVVVARIFLGDSLVTVGASVEIVPDIPELRERWNLMRRLQYVRRRVYRDSVTVSSCWFVGADTVLTDVWEPTWGILARDATPIDLVGNHRFTGLRTRTASGCPARYLLVTGRMVWTDPAGLAHLGVPVAVAQFAGGGGSETLLVALNVEALAWSGE